MPDDFDKLTGSFYLTEEQQSQVNEAAAIHAAYFWRLVNTHGVPHHISAGFTETFIDAAVVDPED